MVFKNRFIGISADHRGSAICFSSFGNCSKNHYVIERFAKNRKPDMSWIKDQLDSIRGSAILVCQDEQLGGWLAKEFGMSYQMPLLAPSTGLFCVFSVINQELLSYVSEDSRELFERELSKVSDMHEAEPILSNAMQALILSLGELYAERTMIRKGSRPVSGSNKITASLSF